MNQSIVGISFGLMAGFSYFLMTFLGKNLITNGFLDGFSAVFLRFAFFFLYSIPVVSINKASFHLGKQWKLWFFIALRSFGGFGCNTMVFLALQFMPQADVLTIMSTSPIWTAFISRLCFKERIFYSDAPVIFFTITGIIMIVRPPFIFNHILHTDVASIGGGGGGGHLATSADDRIIGSLLALAGSLFDSLVYIALRQLRSVEFGTVNFLSAFGLFAFGTVQILIAQSNPLPNCYKERAMVFVMSIAGVLGAALVTVASKKIPARIVMLTKSTETVFSFIFQILLLNVAPHWLSIAGLVVIFLSLSFLSLRTVLIEKYENPDKKLEKPSFVKFLFIFFK